MTVYKVAEGSLAYLFKWNNYKVKLTVWSYLKPIANCAVNTGSSYFYLDLIDIANPSLKKSKFDFN